MVAIGKAAQAKHGFRAGDQVAGMGEPVAKPKLETADIYKASGLKGVARGAEAICSPPPFFGPLPALEVYRERGHRRLAACTYSTKCPTCIWGCEMPLSGAISCSCCHPTSISRIQHSETTGMTSAFRKGGRQHRQPNGCTSISSPYRRMRSPQKRCP